MLLNSRSLLRKTLLLLFAFLCCACLILIPSKGAEAHTTIPHKATDVTQALNSDDCSPSSDGTSSFCFQPTNIVINPACTGTQYWNTNDYSGAPISWTYTNGNSWCVSVRYNVSGLIYKNCTWIFYVPNGYADATFVIGYVLNGVHYVSGPINEANITGWYTFLRTVTGITSFDFSDNNGQAPGSQQLGWGSDWHHSLSAQCLGG